MKTALVVLALMASVQEEGPTGPRDPGLRAAYVTLLREAEILTDRESEQVASLDTRMVELSEKLTGPEEKWAGCLQHAWGKRLYEKLSIPWRAERAWARAVHSFRKAGEEGLLAQVLLNQGVALDALGRFPDALGVYSEAEALFQKRGDRHRLAEVAQNRGALFRGQGRYLDALAEYERAAPIYHEVGDRLGEAQIAQNRGTALDGLGRWLEALALHDAADRLYQELGRDAERAQVAQNRGNTLLAMGQFEGALAEFARAEAGYRRHRDRVGIAMLAMDRGNAWFTLARFERAMDDYAAAEKGAVTLGDEALRARVAQNRALVLHSQGRLEDALREAERARGMFRIQEDRRGLADIAALRTKILSSMGSFHEALEASSEAFKRWQDLGNQDAVADLHRVRGTVLQRAGRQEEAWEEYRKADELFQKLGNRQARAELGVNRGNILLTEGRPAEALGAFGEAGAIFGEVLARHIQPLGLDASVEYRKYFGEALAGTLRALHALGDSSPDHLASAYRLVQTFHGLGMAQFLAERGRLRRPVVPEDFQREHDGIREALQQARARFRNLVGRRGRGPLVERGRVEKELSEASEEIRRLTGRWDAFLEKLRALDSSYAAVAYPRGASLRDVQEVLPEGTALLEFVLESDSACVFVLTRRSKGLAWLGPPGLIREEVDRAAAALEEAAPGARAGRAVEPLRALGKSIAPALAAVPREQGIRTLLVSPDGALCRVPFEALLREDVPPDSEISRWPFVVREYSVAYVHSGTTLRETTLARRNHRTGGLKRFVGFGLPSCASLQDGLAPLVPERGDLRPLPGSGLEILEVARLFTDDLEEAARLDRTRDALVDGRDALVEEEIVGRRCTVLLRSRAEEAALKGRPDVRRATILHLACHAQADLTSPVLSFLALTPSAKPSTAEDGFLFLGELRDLNLDAELLVLSACETNAGRLMPFEGTASLSRAALAAGARSVLSTLWRVPDESARDLVVRFYREWLRDSGSKPEALARAKREALRDGIPLRTWAAYTLWDAGP